MSDTPKKTSGLKDLIPNLKLVFSIGWKAAPVELVGQLIAYIIGAFTPIAMSLTLQAGIDALNIAAAAKGTIGVLPAAIVTVLIARAVIRASSDFIFWILGGQFFERRIWFKVQNALVLRFQGKVSTLDLGHLEDTSTQNLITKARESINWRPLNVLDQMVRTVNSGVTFVGSLLLLLQFGWWIPVVIAASTVPRLWLRAKFSALQWGVYDGMTPLSRKLWYIRWLLTEVEPIREGRILGSHEELLGRVKTLQDQSASAQLKVADRAAFAYILPVLIEDAVLLGIGLYVAPNVVVGIITVGTFTLLLNLAEQMSSAMGGILMNIAAILENNLYITDLRKILNLPTLLPRAEHPTPFAAPDRPPRVEFRDVHFSYPGSGEVLHGVSFTIEPGQRVALVGVNGAGKSTIVKLLCRFYDVTGGQVLVDGIDVRELNQDEWHRRIGTLFQEFVRYSLTIRENVLLGAPENPDDTRLHDALRMSGANAYVATFPKGVDTQLGRQFEGEELSAGQWQKLAIARALYRASPLLILDEPTSAIDALAEEEIFRSLEQHYAGKSLFLISHRFSTVRGADKILVLEHGRVTEEGTHAELVEKNGLYATMFKAQAKGYQ